MTLWGKYQTWFAGLKEREQRIVAFAVLVGGLFVGYTYGIEPGLLKAQREKRAAGEATAGAAALTQQAAAIRAATTDPDAPLRAELERLKAQMAAQDGRFADVERSLVAPDKMPALLESFLGRGNALQLASLRTLAPTPVIERKPAADPAKPVPAVGEAARAAAADAAGAPNLFKHGVELKLVGTYADLLGYLRALEGAPQRLVWGQMDLVTLEYPRSQLTLTVYTLSLDKSWLVL